MALAFTIPDATVMRALRDKAAPRWDRLRLAMGVPDFIVDSGTYPVAVSWTDGGERQAEISCSTRWLGVLAILTANPTP